MPWYQPPSGVCSLPTIEVMLTISSERRVRVCGSARGPGHGDDDAEAEAEAGTCLAAMITAAQDAGQVHPDVTVADIHLLISTAPVGQPADLRSRWFTVVLPGLTSTAFAATPGHALQFLPGAGRRGLQV